MQIVTRTLKELEIGPATTFAGLTLFPLLTRPTAPGDRAYRTLDEAIAAGSARVAEVSKGGSVPELRFENEGDMPVLLIDGEELVGAKQNRILNLTILAGAKTSITIPVSCVEAGRWASRSAHFATDQQVMYSSGRGRKTAQVTDAMRMAGIPRSDQGEIWRDIASMSARMGVSSATSEMKEIFDRSDRSLDEYVRAFRAVDGQVGAIFALGSGVGGVELFDHPETLRKLLPKLVRSWALDAIDIAPGSTEAPPVEKARALLERIGAADVSEHDSVGLGRDLRFAGQRLAGGALVHEDRVVHLCAFDVGEEAGGNGRGIGSRMARASRRQRWGWSRG